MPVVRDSGGSDGGLHLATEGTRPAQPPLDALGPVTTSSRGRGTGVGPATATLAWAPAVRDRLCARLSSTRPAKTFEKNESLFNLGDTGRTLFLIQCGVVKRGTITDEGREIIYDIRKDGDLVGELCAIECPRRVHAVALERTVAAPIGLDEVWGLLAEERSLLREFIGILGRDLAGAYQQMNRMAQGSVMHGLIQVLKGLASKLGRPVEGWVEIDAYVTQEELAQMVVARRERVSTALNSLRRRGLVQYTARGHLLLDVRALDRENLRSRALPAASTLLR